MDTLLPSGHFEMPTNEKIGIVAALMAINVLSIVSLITQQYYPPPSFASNSLLAALSITCFIASGLVIYDEGEL